MSQQTRARSAAKAAMRPARERVSAGLVLVMLLPLVVPAGIAYSGWSAEHAEQRAWDIHGPPCPLARRPLVGTPSRPPEAFVYAGARFVRRSGAVSCAELRTGLWRGRRIFHVCQFSAPVLLSVTDREGSRLYEPGPGQTTTVRLEQGRAACVVGGWFTG